MHLIEALAPRSRRVAGLAALTAVLLLAACGPSSSSRETATTRRVALVMKSLGNEFFLTMENGAREHQKAHTDEYELLANGIKDERDVAKQIDLVEQMIAQRVDAIVIAPADSKALVPVCKKASDAGIMVVNIDNKFDDAVLEEAGLKLPFVGPDNRKGARLVGEHLAEHLQAGDAVAILEGAPNTFNGAQRKLGFEDAIEAAELKLVSSQSGFWQTKEANEAAAAIINEHPELKAFLCANDDMALGAIAALRSAGKLDQVQVVGYDNISAVRQLLREGAILATADQHADQLAVFGIEYALNQLQQENPAAPTNRETPVDLITAESLADE
jgi:ribose transport system substrate-binding protein